MSYKQLNQDERFRIAALKCERLGIREIGRRIGRSASTVSREIRRNAYPTDGSYKAAHADRMASGRRRRGRKVSGFGEQEWRVVEALIRQDYIPEQVSGYLESRGDLCISHETIYAHVWRDKTLVAERCTPTCDVPESAGGSVMVAMTAVEGLRVKGISLSGPKLLKGGLSAEIGNRIR
jgi:IS30 family transposase